MLLTPLQALGGGGFFAIKGDWCCPNCGDYQFARNSVCRRCGRKKDKEGLPVSLLDVEAGSEEKEGMPVNDFYQDSKSGADSEPSRTSLNAGGKGNSSAARSNSAGTIAERVLNASTQEESNEELRVAAKKLEEQGRATKQRVNELKEVMHDMRKEVHELSLRQALASIIFPVATGEEGGDADGLLRKKSEGGTRGATSGKKGGKLGTDSPKTNEREEVRREARPKAEKRKRAV